jgi:hypothetical protein
MSMCIVCKEPLSETEILLIMSFHAKCASTIIREVNEYLDIRNKEVEEAPK